MLLVILVVTGSRMSRLSQANYSTSLIAATAPPSMMAQQELRYAADSEFAPPAPGFVDNALLPMDEYQAQDDGVKRVVLKNASLTVVVADVDAKMAQINALASEYGGWVVNAQVSRTGTGEDSRVAYAVITIRVAAERLDQALRMIKDGADQVESESVNGQDVTQDYVDLSSQLTNLQAAERQLQEIMSRATKTEDVLNVYNELVRVRGEIETTQGRLRYYDEASATSSIQVTVTPTPIVQPVEIGGWRPLETARNAFQALVNLLQNVADIAITVAILGVPLLVVVGIPVWWLRRRRMTRPTQAGTAG
jgi:hypothetical protein